MLNRIVTKKSKSSIHMKPNFVQDIYRSNMKFTWTLLFLLHQLISCDAFYASPVSKVSSKLMNDVSDYLTQAAQILNVAEPGKMISS